MRIQRNHGRYAWRNRCSALLLLLVAVGLPAYVHGQVPADVTQVQARLCNQSCVYQFHACSGQSVANNPEACNTRYVVCAIACQDCTGVFGKCATGGETSPGSDLRPCFEEFKACRRKLMDPKLDSRPLITFEGGNGSSPESAVVIKGAVTGREGIRAEALWIGINHPEWRKEQQSLVTGQDGKHYDAIDYIDNTGGRRTIYFDITDFFGKKL
jgi:hypothetical protein